MFIRAVKRTNGYSKKTYYKYTLVESVRTEKGPRQKVLLNLGDLKLDKSKWKTLANRIECHITGMLGFFPAEEEIETLAKHYAKLYIKQKMAEKTESEENQPEFQSVDISNVSSTEAKSIGCEHVGLAAMKQLGFFLLFQHLGFTSEQKKLASLAIVGRLIHPGSEHGLKNYAQQRSALDKLLNTDFSRLGQNSLYRISDLLFEHRDQIESFLRENTRKLLGLSETIILYDLTNTYFEGDVSKCSKAKHGRSKEKRYDRPLVTVGFVLDHDGFLKSSRIFEGDVSEPKTLIKMVEAMHDQTAEASPPLPLDRPTVVMDAGIASEENLSLLKERGFSYIAVSKSRPDDIPEGEFQKIKDGVHAKSFMRGDELFLHCQSDAKTKKEESMTRKAREKMENNLEYLREGLNIKGRLKSYDKVLERIGRLRSQFSRVSSGYEIHVQKKDEKATDITWTFDQDKLGKPYDGTYFLRTDRTDLTTEKIWHTYIMLNTVEDAFKSIKSELGLRPNFHQRADRIEGHIFITILAYHLLRYIQYNLHQSGIHHRWSTIRTQLATHCQLTTSAPREEGGKVHIQHCTTPTLKQSEVYSALGISNVPIKPKYIIDQQM